jgi:SAM-dependent methyltransferase
MRKGALDADFAERFARLQGIVRCPVTGAPLELLPMADLLPRLDAGEVARMPGGAGAAFLARGAGLAYPVARDIVHLLPESALHVAPSGRDAAAGESDREAARVKRSVRRWYDEFGWTRTAAGTYHDVALFSEPGDTGYRLYQVLSHLALMDRLTGGTFLLDAASGAIATQEYLAFSWFYEHRVCVDISLTALQEARATLGRHGYYVLADLSRLPFQADGFDGVVSGYTIQHIPEDEQEKALSELVRVVKPDRPLCVLTNFEPARARRPLLRGLRLLFRLAGTHRGETAPAGDLPQPPHPLYSHLRDVRWWRDAASRLGAPASIQVLRLLGKGDFEYFFGRSKRAARRLHLLERLFPGVLARVADHLLVTLRKQAAE